MDSTLNNLKGKGEKVYYNTSGFAVMAARQPLKNWTKETAIGTGRNRESALVDLIRVETQAKQRQSGIVRNFAVRLKRVGKEGIVGGKRKNKVWFHKK